MRYLLPEVEQVLMKERKMAFIAGPRQVGKTTLSRALLDGRGEQSVAERYFNWDNETHRQRILKRPDGFWPAGDLSGRTRIVLDEIHKYPRWKRLLKGIFDVHQRELELIVTGSGRLDVYQKGGDSLLGRYGLHRLHPFTVAEIVAGGHQSVLSPAIFEKAAVEASDKEGASDALEQVLRFTGFPEPFFAQSEARLVRWRRSRRDLVLREDLRDLTRVRELGLIDNLVSLLPERVGSPLSVNALREDLGVAFDTASNWLAILARLYFTFEIRPFAGKLARTLRREVKTYLFDHSVIESEGARFENVVALHLLKLVDAWNDRGDGDFELSYVRDKERREVDFLVTNNRKPFILVEAKVGDDEVHAPLRYFHQRLAPKLSVQVVKKGKLRRAGDILVVPADRFLSLM